MTDLSELEKLARENEALTKALTGLTCGGSEFFVRKGERYVADIDACVSWVRRARMDAQRLAVKAIRDAKTVARERDALRAGLEEIEASLYGAWLAIEDEDDADPVYAVLERARQLLTPRSETHDTMKEEKL